MIAWHLSTMRLQARLQRISYDAVCVARPIPQKVCKSEGKVNVFYVMAVFPVAVSAWDLWPRDVGFQPRQTLRLKWTCAKHSSLNGIISWSLIRWEQITTPSSLTHQMIPNSILAYYLLNTQRTLWCQLFYYLNMLNRTDERSCEMTSLQYSPNTVKRLVHFVLKQHCTFFIIKYCSWEVYQKFGPRNVYVVAAETSIKNTSP